MKNVLGAQLDQWISRKIVDVISEAEREVVVMLGVDTHVSGGTPNAYDVREAVHKSVQKGARVFLKKLSQFE